MASRYESEDDAYDRWRDECPEEWEAMRLALETFPARLRGELDLVVA